MTPQEKSEFCLRLYNDIINGYSTYHIGSKEVYIKHLRDVDYAFFEEKKNLFKNIALERGLQTEKDFFELLDKTGNWSNQEEENYQRLSKEIQNLNKSKSKIFVEAQRNIIDSRLKEKEKQFKEIEFKRKQIKVNTVEEYDNSKINDFILCYSFYKTPDLKEYLFDFEEYQEIPVEDTYVYTNSYYFALNKFSSHNIKRVAHSTFFLNTYLLSKSNPFYFMGKAIKDFTTYQSNLCSYGNGCKSVLENSDNSPPDLQDVDDMIDWFERERDIINRKYKQKPSSSSQTSSSGKTTERFEGVSYTGATKKEVSQIAASEQARPVNFVEAAEKLKKELKKDSLSVSDILKIHQ